MRQTISVLLTVWRHLLVGGLCLLVNTGEAQNTTRADLFTATVPVDRQNEASRQEAQRRALKQVFIKVSGVPAIEAHPAIDAALEQVDAFITRYGFLRRPIPGQNEWQLYFEASFDSASILKLLRRENLTVWSAARPKILAWVGVSDADGRRILDAASTDLPASVLLNQAEIRGIPLLLPVMDLPDLEYVDTTTVFENVESALRLATKRYKPEGMMVLQLIEDGGWWEARWLFFWGKDALKEKFRATSLDSVVRKSVDLLANNLALRYATSNLGQTQGTGEPVIHWVQIDRVRNLKTYAEITDFFHTIGSVHNVQLVRLDYESLLLSMHSNVPRNHLLRLVKLNYRLQEAQNSDAKVIRLFWRG